MIDVYMRALEGARYQATHPSTLMKRRSALHPTYNPSAALWQAAFCSVWFGALLPLPCDL